jgi:hypothetical protein
VAAAKASVLRAEHGVVADLQAEAAGFQGTLTGPGTQAAMGVVELENLRMPWLEVGKNSLAQMNVTFSRNSLTTNKQSRLTKSCHVQSAFMS